VEAMFEVRLIGREAVRQAFAVMLLGFPGLSFAEFRKLVASTRKGALSGLFDRRGYIHAVFRSRIELVPGGSRRLDVSDLVLSDSLSQAVASQMVESLLRSARSEGCDQLTVQWPTGGKSAIIPQELLAKLGFYGESVLMARRI